MHTAERRGVFVRAFTLIELVAVVIVLALLALIALFAYRGVVKSSQDAVALEALRSLGSNVYSETRGEDFLLAVQSLLPLHPKLSQAWLVTGFLLQLRPR